MTLYRQYRPNTFSNLIGQSNVALTLQQALLQGRAAHAYLFSGPRGTGKTTTARIFARALTCLHPVKNSKKGEISYEPCNTCTACQSILAGHATDVIEIDAASNRGIEDIRSLREQVQYPPLQLSRKIYIIDEVHMLTGEAFNALLKTLEEPPAHCVFILATTELHKVPATIRSRCQLLRFERGSTEAIIKKLDHIVSQEKWQVEPGVTALIAAHADGGFRDAETLLEHLITQFPYLKKSDAIDALGIVDITVVEQLIVATLAGNTDDVLRILQAEAHAPGARAEHLTARLIEAVQTRLQASSSALPHLTYALGQLMEAFILQKSAPSPVLPLEIACLNIAQYGGQSAQPAASQRVNLPAQRIAAAPAPVRPNPQPVEPEKVPVVEIRDTLIKDIRRAWKEAAAEIARTNLPLGQMLRDTLFHSAEEPVITIQVRYKFHAEKLGEKKNRILVEKLLQELTGTEWRVSYELSESIPKRKPSKELPAGSSPASDAAAVFGKSS